MSQIATSNTGATSEDGLTVPKVYTCRGVPVLVDADVAVLFGVETRRLNEQLSRNASRFAEDYAFRLTAAETADLMSQNAISNEGGSSARGGRRKPATVFTEHGVVMAATLLRSDKAIEASRFIVRVFVEARRQPVASASTDLVAVGPRGLSVETAARTGLMAKLSDAVGRVLDVLVDPQNGSTVRDEARAVAAEGVGALKDYLRKAGVQNEKTLGEVRKLLAEADAIDAETALKQTEQQHRHFALVARQLRLILETQRYLESGSPAEFLEMLKDLSK